MRFPKIIVLFLLIFILFSFAFPQKSSEESKHLSLNDLLVKLKFTSRISTPEKELNEQLIKAVKEQKVDFLLDEKTEKDLRKAGAGDLLIETIRTNSNKLSLEFISNALDSSAKNGITLDEINADLISQVCKNGTDFELDESKKTILKKSGASDKLLAGIDGIEELKRLYILFVQNYDKNTIEQKKVAIQAAKDFIVTVENSACEKDKKYQEQYVNYFKEVIPELEKWIKGNKPCYYPIPPENKYIVNFDKAYKKQNWKQVFEAGEEILKHRPEFVDVPIVLAAIGFDKLAKPNKKPDLNAKTIYFAELVIELLEKDVKSKDYGAYQYRYKNEKYKDGRSNALGWMNYIIGYIKFHRLGQKEEAIPYFEKALRYESEVQNFPDIRQILINRKANFEPENKQ